MKRLIVIDHEKYIPAFMLSILNYAKNVYDDVIYLNYGTTSNAHLVKSISNISVINTTSFQKRMGQFSGLCKLVESENIKEFKKARTSSNPLAYKKTTCMFVVVKETLLPVLKKLLKQFNKEDEVTIMSTWFSELAYTLAKLKACHPRVTAVSLAHSYEILVSRNPNLPLVFRNMKHDQTDGVFFIAETVRRLYMEGTGSLNDEQKAKMHVNYLGTNKNRPVVNHPQEGVFNLLTCSRIIPLKRLDILIKALECWSGPKIRWTHLGTGALENEIRKKSAEVMKANPNVEIALPGYMDNWHVKDFYENNPVDLFVNLSSIEGIPVSIMEAISYGIPILATDVGGTKEVVKPSFGKLLDAEITGGIILDELQMFYKLSNETKQAYRDNAFLYWSQNFDADKTIKQLFEHIDSLRNIHGKA